MAGQAPRTTAELLSRLPDGTAVANAMRALGMWTADAHTRPGQRKQFRRDLSSMSGQALADEQAYWSSEAGRIGELHGLLVGQKIQAQMMEKLEQSKARVRVRSKHQEEQKDEPKPSKITAGEVNDRAEEDPSLQKARETAAMVEKFLASLEATKEATLLYLNTLSREITRRGDEMKSRL